MVNEQFTWLTPRSQLEKLGLTWPKPTTRRHDDNDVMTWPVVLQPSVCLSRAGYRTEVSTALPAAGTPAGSGQSVEETLEVFVVVVVSSVAPGEPYLF